MGRNARVKHFRKWVKTLPAGQRDWYVIPVGLAYSVPKRSGRNNPPRIGNVISYRSMQHRVKKAD